MNKYLKIALVVVIVAALAGAYVVLKPKLAAEKPAATKSATAAHRQPRKVVSLNIVGGKLQSGDGTIKVKQGTVLALKVTSDQADELHIHGYDKELELEAGKPESIKFTVDKPGSFEAELHKADQQVFVLEVTPE